MKKIMILESVLLLSGVMFGVLAFFCLPEEQILQLQRYLTSQMQTLAGAASLSEAAGPIFQSNFMDFVRIYLAGICLLGLPLLVLFLFLKGFSLGFSACFLVTHSPLLLLSRLLYFPVLLAAIAYSCRFSFILLQNRVSSPARQLLQYTVTFGLLLILVLICSYIDGFSCSPDLNSLL